MVVSRCREPLPGRPGEDAQALAVFRVPRSRLGDSGESLRRPGEVTTASTSSRPDGATDLGCRPTAKAVGTPEAAARETSDRGRRGARAGGAVRFGRRLLAAHPVLALVALLAVIAAVPRLALQLQAPIFLSTDSASYVRPAYDLVSGQGLTISLKRPIGYPMMLAAIFSAFGPNLLAAAAFQHALGILTVGLTYLLGRACFSRRVGFVAALLVAISGPQLSFEQTLLSETLCTLLLAALALVMIRAMGATTLGPALLAGVLLGVTASVKPAAQLLLPLAMLFASLPVGPHRRRLVSAGVVAGAFALVVGPLMLRNLSIHGSISLGGGLSESLLDSTADYSRGTFVFDGPSLPPETDQTRRAGRRIIQAAVDGGKAERQILEQLRSELGLNESDAERLAQQLVLEVIARQPLDFLGRIPVFIQALYEGGQRSNPLRWDSYQLWRNEPGLQKLVLSPTRAQEANRPQTEALLGFYQPSRFGVALPLLALAGLVAAGRIGPPTPALVPGVLALLWVLIHVTLDGPPARYRYPVEPFVNVLAVGAVWMACRYAAAAWRGLFPRIRPLTTSSH